MSLAISFSACTLTLNTKGRNGSPVAITTAGDGSFQAASFFVDSSGHSTFILPLDLKFACQEDLDLLLSSNCICPPPMSKVSNPKETNDDSKEEGRIDSSGDLGSKTDDSSISDKAFIGFEARCSSDDHFGKTVVVEAITILATSSENLSVYFETEVTVRASSKDVQQRRSKSEEPSTLKVNIEVTPVMTFRKETNDPGGVLSQLLALELGAVPDHMQKETSARMQEIRLNSVSLELALSSAFTISVKSVPGGAMGRTMISLTVRHSNLHREPVTLSNLAVHPGSSKYEIMSLERGKQSGRYSVTNMTSAVQWSFAPQTELRLPLTLHPYEAYSTVLVMTGVEDMRSRNFVSPVSVTGVVGRLSGSSSRCRVVVAAAAHWSTELAAVEPADAFRLEINVASSEVKLGEEMVVFVRVFNLSLEPRDLMLLMSKEIRDGVSESDELVNSAVVSEMDGYTFGVWGITGEDNGTVRLTRDHSILAVDGALMIGDVPGQHAVDAELRFVPLRQGCLQLPNWRLYDKSSGKWYTCTHSMMIVAT